MKNETEIRKIDLSADFVNNLGVATAGGGIITVMIIVAETVMLGPLQVAFSVVLILMSFLSGAFCHLVARSILEMRSHFDS